MKRDEINNLLLKLCFSKSEIDVYLKLLEFGPSSISNIANRGYIPRTTVHENISRLLSKGLVAQSIRGSRKVFIPENPSKLRLLLTEKRVELEGKQQEIKDIEKMLPRLISAFRSDFSKQMTNKDDNEVKLKFYEGKKAVSKIYKEILTYNEILAYVNSIEIDKYFPENFKLFTEAHANNKKMILREIMMVDNNIIDYEYIEKFDTSRYAYKYAPDSVDFSFIDYLIFGTKVAIINIKAKPSCIIIDNKDYNTSARTIFELLWNSIN